MSENQETPAPESSSEGKRNLILWRSVETTPPEMTKPVSYGKRRYTTIDPQWQLRRATSKWGPYGDRWGLRNISYEIRDVKKIEKVSLLSKEGVPGEKPDDPVKVTSVRFTEQMVEYIEQVMFLRAEFFYPIDDQEVSFPIINDDRFKPGDETFKKLLTNTRSKALSWLGFSADVFLGKFDDTNYVRGLTERIGKENKLVEAAIAKIMEAKTIEELQGHADKLKVVVRDNKLTDTLLAQELSELVEERRWTLIS